MEIGANQAAFATATGLAIITAGSAVGAAVVASTTATVALGVLAVVAGGASIASITAWIDTKNKTAQEYFLSFQDHLGVGIAGMSQLAAQVLLQAVLQGIAEGISSLMRRKIAGPDVTFGRA
ncbi:MAG: hypothetical protein WAM28_07975 [Chlamydiales bacterium]